MLLQTALQKLKLRQAALRGAQTLRGRPGRGTRIKWSAPSSLYDEFDFNFGRRRASLAKGDEILVATPDGKCRLRSVSAILNKDGKIVLKIKKANMYHLRRAHEPVRNASYRKGCILFHRITTNKGRIELKAPNYVLHKKWVTTMNHMLMLSKTFSNHQKIQLFLSPSSSPTCYYYSSSSSSLRQHNFQNKISPSILLIIVILAVIFFISGLLHLLVRYLLRPPSRDPDELDDATALQGQLQQLFHLHDAGVDNPSSTPSRLPLPRHHRPQGPLRLRRLLVRVRRRRQAPAPPQMQPRLPRRLHRYLAALPLHLPALPEQPPARLLPASSCSPVLLLLESGGGESFRDIGSERMEIAAGDDEFGPLSHDIPPKTAEKEDAAIACSAVSDEKIVSVKLGKFRSVEICGGEGEGSSDGNGNSNSNNGGGNNTNLDQRRCFSMGSYEYVMDEASSLKVPIKPPKKKPTAAAAAKRPGHRLAMSECDCNSRREGFKDSTRRESATPPRPRGRHRNSEEGELFGVENVAAAEEGLRRILAAAGGVIPPAVPPQRGAEEEDWWG
uniref:Pleckstrin-like plant domain-containing protein n=1 Tax=Ananas comosus var. bracteatus TaxID=296719 RepID=A0A6V7P421_ANACO|nr:unnamed protein product [Ananas comosus var. bracteatus]